MGKVIEKIGQLPVSLIALSMIFILSGCQAQTEQTLTLDKARQIAQKVCPGEITYVFLLNADKDKEQEICASYRARSGYSPYWICLLDKIQDRYKQIWAKEIEGNFVEEIDIKDLDGDGTNEIFYVVFSGGSGYHENILFLYSPGHKELFSFSVGFKHSAAEPIPEVDASANLGLKKFKVFKVLFDKVKWDYGYRDTETLAKKQHDPEFAPYFWKVDNGYIKEGEIKIRRYKGRPPLIGSIENTFKEGNLVWYTCFKGGVYEYNEGQNTFFVVYFPKDVYNWPTVLKKKGDLLFIGTRGDGLIVYNVKKRSLRNYVKKGREDVGNIEVLDDAVLINKHHKVPLEQFKF